MRVARALANKNTDEFAKAGKLVDVSFVKGQSLSLTAARLLALMILTAAGDAWKPITHRIRKSDVRRGHKGNERISDMLVELHGALFAEDDRSWRGRRSTRRFPLIEMSNEEADGEDGVSEGGWIEWRFTPDARRLIQESETYAVMSRQAVVSFRSAYALRLYEIGAMRLRRRQANWKGDLTALRAALGIRPEIYTDFAQLRRKVLDVAKAEIDQLAHFKIEWREVRRGRTVVEVEVQFIPKEPVEQIGVVDELARHSAGRRARRERTTETVVEELAVVDSKGVAPLPSPTSDPQKADRMKVAAFPAGSPRFAGDKSFYGLAIEHGGGWDVDVIANSYREHMGARLGKLSGTKLLTSWTGFCQSYAARRGRPA